MFLYTLYKPGWANLFNRRVICRNQKHQRTSNPVCSVDTKMAKNVSVAFIDVQKFISLKFLFDLLVPENLDSTFVKALQINSPKCSFFKVARWFDFTNFITEQKITATCCAIRRNGLYTGILNSGYLLSGTCRQKLSVEWH